MPDVTYTVLMFLQTFVCAASAYHWQRYKKAKNFAYMVFALCGLYLMSVLFICATISGGK
jgi:hypothetical protein